MTNATDWDAKTKGALKDLGLPSKWGDAHRATVDDALVVTTSERAQGARMCVNMAAAHIPEFVKSAGNYKNAYDLDAQAPIVGAKTNKASTTRQVVDSLLPLPAGQTPQNTYFGAVETTGCGVRFYGDFCLVLSRSAVPDDTVILDRNSYDLVRSPLDAWRTTPGSKVAAVEQGNARGKAAAKALAGEFAKDLTSMVMIGLAERGRLTTRRLTIGQVSDVILEDEDYIEVLKAGSFTISHIDEVRTSAAEAAAESLIGDRLQHGPPPNFAETLWRSQRRRASSALGRANRAVRVVTSGGRVRA